MKKALLTASVHYHFTAFHFPLIDLLHANGYTVEISAKEHPEKEPVERLTDRIEKLHDIDFDRSPLSRKNISAYKALKKLIDDGDYAVVHCNTPVVGVLTRFAARKARKKGTKIIYTAHGFHFYKGASKLNWLLFYPIEKLFGRLFTDCLITIGDEDETRARHLKLCKNVKRIHGVGVDSCKFANVSLEEKSELRQQYGFSDSDIICLCTGELNENKNQQLLVKASALLKEGYPDFKILFAGAGDKLEELKALAKQLNVENTSVFLGYRTDIDSLVKISDFIASVSLREGLPVNIIEGMFAAKPAVVTHNRGHNELVADCQSGIFVPADDADSAAIALETLIKNEALRLEMGRKANERAQKYSSEKVKNELEEIYKEIIFN